MKYRKRSLSLLLALLLCLSLFPATAFSEEALPEEELSAGVPTAESVENVNERAEESPVEEAALQGTGSGENAVPENGAEQDIIEEASLPETDPTEDVLTEDGKAEPEEDADTVPDERPVIIGFADPEVSQITEQRKPALCEVLKQLPEELSVRLAGTPAAENTDDPDAPILEETEDPAALYGESEWKTLQVTWECVQDYDEWLNDYDFYPVIEGFRLAEGVEVPVVRLTVEDLSTPACGHIESGAQSEIPIVGATGDLHYAARSYNAYELGLLPAIRDQNPYGTCWAHAAIGAVEADLIAGGQASPGSINLSELHLLFFSKNKYTDPKGLNTKDWISDDYGRNFMSGGNGMEASLTMANMVGPVLESSAPYSLAGSYAPSGTDAKSMNAAQLVAVYKINPGDRDAIKEAILTHGSVTASIAAVDSYYSAKNNSYCYPYSGTNHDVMLVGWDDGFSRDKFLSKPGSDGAWLVRNSWGKQGYSWYGYFWLSYEDQSLLSSKECWTYDAETKRYDNVYAYDSLPGLYWYTDVNAGDSVIQRFTVDSQERVEAVGIMLGADNSVRISVTDGTHSASGSYSAPFEGFYMVHLDTPFTVSGRKNVTVTVSYNTPGSVFYEGGTSSDYNGNLIMEAGCDSGGFVIHHAQYNWDQEMSEDVRIKLFTNNTVTDSTAVREYVKRCYRVILGREGEPAGVENWVGALLSGQRAGAEIISDFIFSPEFVAQKHSDEDVVAILYRAMMGREPDAGGFANWLGHINNGMSYKYIINGFSTSPEFDGICASYGIDPGSVILDEPRDQNPQVTAFVNRNYLYALLRKGEPGGLNDWTNALLQKAQTPQQVAYGFVFSPECTGRGLSNRDFMEMLYHLYMGRDPDKAGLNNWVAAMDSGMSREQIVESFSQSQEFRNIVFSYGLASWNPDIVFTTTDLYGREYSDSIFANAKLTMLNEWAYWCGPCINELKDLQKLQNNYASRGLQIFGVSDNYYSEYNRKEFERQGITYPSLIETESLSDVLYTGYVPTTIFVDGNGHILCDEPYIGSRDYNSWAGIVEEYLR